MPPLDVRMTNIVDLEAQRVLEVVAALFRVQTRHHRGPLGDADDLQLAGLRQCAGDIVNPLGSRYAVRLSTEVELVERTDVATSLCLHQRTIHSHLQCFVRS